MTELLHTWAIAPAAIGACCLAADRGRARWPDAVVSALMLAAMLDAVLTRFLAPVYWAAILIGAAMALAAATSPRRRSASPTPRGGMGVHTALGLIAMATLQLGMAHGTADGALAGMAAAHAHGDTGRTLSATAMVIGAIAYAAFTAALLTRSHRALERVQLACMGVSVLLMAVGAAV